MVWKPIASVAAALGLCLILPRPALADAVDISARTAVWLGRQKPAVILTVNEAVRSATLRLHRGSERDVVLLTKSDLPRGAVVPLEFDLPLGKHSLSGILTIVFEDGKESSVPLRDVVFEVVGEFTLEVPEERIDLQRGRLQLKLSRAAGACRVRLRIEGQPAAVSDHPFNGEPSGTWLEVGWRPPGAAKLTLAIKLDCRDAAGIFHTGTEIFPWSIDVPHEEVVFAPGQWSIGASEKVKVERAAAAVGRSVARFGQWLAGVKLFVAGHTDTVGNASANQRLSLRRAEAIAGALRQLGVGLPMMVAGFGESRLAHPTADETAHQGNRRARYIIAVRPPPGDWRPVRP